MKYITVKDEEGKIAVININNIVAVEQREPDKDVSIIYTTEDYFFITPLGVDDILCLIADAESSMVYWFFL